MTATLHRNQKFFDKRAVGMTFRYILLFVDISHQLARRQFESDAAEKGERRKDVHSTAIDEQKLFIL